MIKNYGFIINKLIIVGKDKEDAYLEFKKGLNVVFGASDTGKTFIFQILDYIFGGGNKPKEIEESKGYEEVYVEIEDFKKNIYTIERNIKNGKMYLYANTYNNKNTVEKINIENKHNKSNKKNISAFLLDLCDCEYKNVIKNKNGEIESFSFRDFLRTSMLGEEKVIAEKSIVISENIRKTSNKNAFKTIITGIEDKGIKTKNEKITSNFKIDAQIEILDNIIMNYSKELESISNSVVNTEDIEELIEEIEKVLNLEKENLKVTEEKRRRLIKNNLEKENEIIFNNKLIEKFELLKENYLSDLKRVEFIDDANYYINQLDSVKCPVCHLDMTNNKIDIDIISKGLYAEKNKLKKKIDDINKTMVIIKEKNNKINLIRENFLKEIDIITHELNLKLMPLISLKMEELDEVLDRKDKLNKRDFIERKLEETKLLQEKLSKDKECEENEVVINAINDDVSKELSDKISNLLDEWKLFDKPKVKFDFETYDLIINDRKKSSFGKGYRAIINSAFTIAIMKYNIMKGLSHPGIIILDSPLITFKEKDLGKEVIGDIVKKSFYKYLSKNFKEEQIIILENAEPDKELYKKIMYYHFTKNNLYGRYGFFPI